MNRDFQQYVTSQAFVLTLSRPMVDLLAMLHSRYHEEPALERLNAFYALRRRGLAEMRKDRMVYLTEEGKLVLELCRRAGLVQERIKAAA